MNEYQEEIDLGLRRKRKSSNKRGMAGLAIALLTACAALLLFLPGPVNSLLQTKLALKESRGAHAQGAPAQDAPAQAVPAHTHMRTFEPSTPAPPLQTPAPDVQITVHPSTQLDAEAIASASVLQLGVEHAIVAEVQKKLMALGYFAYDEVTQYYGEATAEAIKLFQRVQELEQTGIADGFLQSLILYEESIPYHMKPGDEGADISLMQERLKELGYFNQNVSGYFGTETESAVATFQRRNKLAQTGVMQLQDIDLLYSFDARPRVDPTPTPTPKPAGSYKGAQGLIDAAKAKLGKKYVWGGNGPDVFDCSGLLYYCLQQVGQGYIGRVKAVHYSRFGDWKEITRMKDLVAGDFIFFKSDSEDVVNHTGIYLGNNKFIHASFKAGEVRTDKLTDAYFERNFVNGRRMFY